MRSLVTGLPGPWQCHLWGWGLLGGGGEPRRGGAPEREFDRPEGVLGSLPPRAASSAGRESGAEAGLVGAGAAGAGCGSGGAAGRGRGPGDAE